MMRACLVKAMVALSWLLALTDGFANPVGISQGFSTPGPSKLQDRVCPLGKCEISLSSTGLCAIRYTDDDADGSFLTRFAMECFETITKAAKTALVTTQEFIKSPEGKEAMEKMRVAKDEFMKGTFETARVVKQDLVESGFPDDVKENAKDVIETLSRPSDVSLPVGVMLGLAVLPFFATLPQTLLTLVLFVGLTQFGRKTHAEKFPNEDISLTDFSTLDKFSLGISAAAGYMLTPSASTVTRAASSTGMVFPGATVALVGLFGVTCVFLFQKVSAPLLEVTKSHITSERAIVKDKVKETSREPVGGSQPLRLTWEPKDALGSGTQHKSHETHFNTWDKELKTREA